MLTTHWTPIVPASLNGMRRDLQDAFQQVYQRQQPGSVRLPLTIWEDDQHVYLEADVPGFLRDAFDIRFQEGRLWITGERPVPKDDGRYRHNERMFGAFSRAVSLPDTIDPSKIEAELENGVLYITIAKKPEAQPMKIAVKGTSGNGKAKRIAKS